ncbi:MAG: hypothetical protein HIU83_06070, partial [Proteobacteria bacterium]|nr:hypothetical protein [Pseudomonadota bacterium]
VSVCLYDVVNGVGGMNHYMLPGDPEGNGKTGTGSARYGIHAMKLLLQHLFQLGADPGNLAAKVFGAGKVMDGMSNVGRQNADFALRFLKDEKIRIAAVDVGDIYPRKICFYPATGRVFVKRIKNQALFPELIQVLLPPVACSDTAYMRIQG